MSEGGSNNFTVNRELRPNPDPSSLTTDQILRENAWVEKLFHSELESIKSTLSAMAKALELTQSKADREPSAREVELRVIALEQVKNEHWISVNKQFESITALANQVSSGNKESLALALQAQREAAAETKVSIKERIEQMDKQFNTAMAVRDETINGQTGRLGSLEGRIVAIESIRAGQSTEKATQQTDKSLLYALIGVIITVILAAFVVMSKFG